MSAKDKIKKKFDTTMNNHIAFNEGIILEFWSRTGLPLLNPESSDKDVISAARASHAQLPLVIRWIIKEEVFLNYITSNPELYLPKKINS